MDRDDPKRIDALENLLVGLMKTETYGPTKRIAIPVAEDNSCTIEFHLPATADEIDSLIEFLNMTRRNFPSERRRVTIDLVNEALEKSGVAPIRAQPQEEP